MSDAGPVRLLDLGSLPAVHTQAVYHVLAEQMDADRPDTVVLCRPAGRYLCLGFHQRGSDVLDYDAAAARDLPIVRRRVGGGLTYLDPDQVFYQFVFHHSRVPPMPVRMYAWLLSAPVAALRLLGLDANLRGATEIEVGSKRIAGIGGGRIGDAAVVVGNVLVDFDYDAMVAVWPDAAPGFRELAAASIRRRITTLRGEACPATAADVERALRTVLGESLGREMMIDGLTDAELAAMEPMAARLTHPERVRRYEDEPRRTRPPLKISARAYLHTIVADIDEVRISGAILTQDGRIADVRLDSSVPFDAPRVREALLGQPLQMWEQVLRAAM